MGKLFVEAEQFVMSGFFNVEVVEEFFNVEVVSFPPARELKELISPQMSYQAPYQMRRTRSRSLVFRGDSSQHKICRADINIRS